jgi:hypothetical protein
MTPRGVHARPLTGLVLHAVDSRDQLAGGDGSGKVLAGEQGDPGVLRAGYLSGGRRHDAL